MATGNNEDTEARAAAAEAEVSELKSQLETLKMEKENFQAEKNRLLAFRTNPEAEKDRIEKAVREAITSKAIELIDKDSEIKTLKGEIRGKKNEIRRQKAELETYERGRIVDQNMLRELSGDTYRLKTSLKDAELYYTGLEDRIFGLEQKLADTEASAEILKSELQMLRAKQKMTCI
jgi:chromosome segregation ATPase